MDSAVNGAVKHSVGAWPCFSSRPPSDVCLSRLLAAVFAVSSLVVYCI